MSSLTLRNKILSFFPPPKFLELPYVGIDLSDQSLKFIELLKSKNSLRIGNYGEKVFPEGLIVDGEIKNREDLITLLKKFRRENNFEFIHISLPEEKAFLFKTLVPDVSAPEIRSNLGFQLEKNVPISLSEAVYDYDIVDKKPAGGMLEVIVTVFPANFVGNYLAVFKEAGLTPLSFEIEAQAIARSVVPRHSKDTCMVVDIGRKRTGLSIVEGGAVQFTSTLDIGGDAISKTVKETLNVSDKEIIRIKNEIGFTRNLGNEELFTNLSTTVGALRDEINKHYNYWQTEADKNKANSIKKIILCGGNANLAGLSEHLSSNMKIEVEKADVWSNVFRLDDYIPPITYEESLGFATAIGLALSDII